MTAKRKDVPVFAPGYVHAEHRLREGKDTFIDAFEAGGVALKAVVFAREALRHHSAEERANAKVGTQLWYCQTIAIIADGMDAAVDENRIRDALSRAFQLGMIVREFGVQHKHGGAIAFHADQASTLSNANEAKAHSAKAQAAKWQAAANEVWKRHPTWGNRRVALELTKTNGANLDTVRRAIQKPS